MDTTVAYRYITSVAGVQGGEPIIRGTRVPVRTIVLAWRGGMLPEEMPEHYPTVTVAEVFEALSYYADNKEEINRHIERHRFPRALIHPSVRHLE